MPFASPEYRVLTIIHTTIPIFVVYKCSRENQAEAVLRIRILILLYIKGPRETATRHEVVGIEAVQPDNPRSHSDLSKFPRTVEGRSKHVHRRGVIPNTVSVRVLDRSFRTRTRMLLSRRFFSLPPYPSTSQTSPAPLLFLTIRL